MPARAPGLSQHALGERHACSVMRYTHHSDGSEAERANEHWAGEPASQPCRSSFMLQGTRYVECCPLGPRSISSAEERAQQERKRLTSFVPLCVVSALQCTTTKCSSVLQSWNLLESSYVGPWVSSSLLCCA
ncbi:hypothetical protein Mapa_007811 [Marchantia paleacea]|nr:hypothetical protein Mapa_007811 [Marchantia paleacea]